MTRLYFITIQLQQFIVQPIANHVDALAALQDWQEKCPSLFKKKVYNLTGLDTLGYPCRSG
jgi:hypothetical protein